MQPCRQLPSQKRALAFVDKPSFASTMGLVDSTGGRTLLAATGFLVSGYSLKESLKLGLIAAAAIEVFVVGQAFAGRE